MKVDTSFLGDAANVTIGQPQSQNGQEGNVVDASVVRI